MNKNIARQLFDTAVEAVIPYGAVANRAEQVRGVYAAGGFNRLLAVGFGKGAWPMARAAEDTLGDLITDGVIVTKEGYADPANPLKTILGMEAAHPVPDGSSEQAAAKIIELLGGADERTLVLCLISGGGSSLLAAPAEGITLDEKRVVTTLLLRSGATIHEMNTVRKHLSRIKGGWLARHAFPATTLALVISDVIGDDLDVISSGPAAPDGSRYADALAVLNRYGLLDAVPVTVLDHLRAGAAGSIEETPKPGDRCFERVEHIIVGNNIIALRAAADRAEELGFASKIISSALCGETNATARQLAGYAIEAAASLHPPLCLIAGGETTIAVTGSGKGGRNMQMALAFALAIEGRRGITFLSGGTDGTDGPTGAAGAIVDGGTIPAARKAGIDPEAFLANNDSYNFFSKAGGLLITGPTGTNVMDIQIILIA